MRKKVLAVIVSTALAASCLFSCVKGPMIEGEAEASLNLTAQVFASEGGKINVPEDYKQKSRELIQFINTNLETISEEYFIATEEDFHAESIEGSATVFIMVEDVFATYIDFNDDNGYMLVTPDFQIYQFVTVGDLDYLKDVDFAYYSMSGGFKFYDDRLGEYVFYEKKENTENSLTTGDTAYAGQSEAGDGFIYDPAAYVAARYPKYTYDSQYTIPYYEHINQIDTSIYLRDTDDGYIHSEGNCVLNAIYSILNSWQRQGICPNLPTSSNVIRYDASVREPNHAVNLSAGWYVNDLPVTSDFAKEINGYKAINNVPLLYAAVRETVYERGYPYDLYKFTNGTNYINVNYLMYFTTAKYGYYPNISNQGSDFSAMEFFFVTHGGAQYLAVSNSSSYGNHGMACIGFKKYKYKSGWWIFSSTKYAYLIEVDDGHSAKLYGSGKSIWYDPDGSSNSGENILVYDHAN